MIAKGESSEDESDEQEVYISAKLRKKIEKLEKKKDVQEPE